MEKVGGANTSTPASAQIVLRICWWGRSVDSYRSTFVRVTAFAASYSPRSVTGLACNLRIGDCVTGVLEKPNSPRNSAALGSWDFGSLEEWGTFAPFTWFDSSMYNATATDIFHLPSLVDVISRWTNVFRIRPRLLSLHRLFRHAK